MSNLVPYTTGQPITLNQTAPPPARRDLPLGTAAWQQFGNGVVRKFEVGNFLFGRLQSGEAVGFDDNRHVMICAGTRGGKGASLVIPNLIFWPGSVVVIDPKGENAVVTARRRAKGSAYSHWIGQQVRILDPFDEVKTQWDDFADLKTCFNPLDLISLSREESIDEAARIAESLVVSESSNDPFWEESARGLLKAFILHVASSRDYLPEERTLVTVRQLVTGGDFTSQKLAKLLDDKKPPNGLAILFSAMKRNPAFNGVVANAGEMYANLEESSPRLMGSILQVARSNTDFLDSPGIKRCVSRSGFALAELKTDPKGTSLYICLPQRFMETHYRWLRMMTGLILAEMERVNRQPASGHPVMVILDEFAALRRMRSIENAAAQIAGFGVKLVFVTQTLAQLKDLYKDNWETFIANCGAKLFFCNDDHFTRQYASNLIGDCEVVRTAQTFSVTKGTSESETFSSSLSISSTHSSNTSYGQQGMSTSSGYSTTISSTSGHSRTVGTNSSYANGYSESVHKRPLAAPDEIGRWFGNIDSPSMLALLAGYQPLALTRAYYFKDRLFAGFYGPHPNYALPLTLQQLREARRQEELRRAEQLEIDAHMKTAAEEARRLRNLNNARQKALKDYNNALQRSCQEREQFLFIREIIVRVGLVLVVSLTFYVLWGRTN